MVPKQVNNFTRRLGAPTNWNHEIGGVCHTLEILDYKGFMISLWELNESERDLIAKGHPVQLWVQGTVHPVVSLNVQEESDNGKETKTTSK